MLLSRHFADRPKCLLSNESAEPSIAQTSLQLCLLYTQKMFVLIKIVNDCAHAILSTWQHCAVISHDGAGSGTNANILCQQYLPVVIACNFMLHQHSKITSSRCSQLLTGPRDRHILQHGADSSVRSHWGNLQWAQQEAPQTRFQIWAEVAWGVLMPKKTNALLLVAKLACRLPQALVLVEQVPATIQLKFVEPICGNGYF